MPLIQRQFKKLVIIASVIITFLFLYVYCSIAESPCIKGAMKIHRMGSYIILINYETYDKWTDNLVFKVHCEFDRGKFTFTSSSLNDLERGWHKTQIAISNVMKKRYGSLREYKIELYKKGTLIDTRNAY
ncbi:MAG: hypothetical protein V3S13_00990 [Candidatus Omnitrophota bacterium]